MLNKGKATASKVALLLSSVLLTSCSLMETEYQEQLKAPASYGSINNEVSAIAKGERALTGESEQSNLEYDFYKGFGDDKLTMMIETVLANNYELITAYNNLRSAELALELTNTNYHPDASASLGASATKDLSQSSKTMKGSNSSLSLSYELDLFGRLSAQSRASYERFKASAYDYQAMRLTIIERTAEYYWNYVYAIENLKLAKEQLATSQKRLELISEMLKQGAADGLEYDQAMVNHKINEQAVYNAAYSLTSARNALNALASRFTEVDAEKDIKADALYSAAKVKVATVIPSALLKQRPDLRSYESKLRATYADTDEATSNFYPQFNISARLNSADSTSLTRFFTDPVGALGAVITFPFLNFNQLSIQREGTLVKKDQARLDFANGFITAVKEVSDRINELSNQDLLFSSYKQELELTERNYQRIEERYRLGGASLSELLDAADSLRSAKNKNLMAHKDLLIASIKLMTAVGGGTFENQLQDTITPQQTLDAAKKVHDTTAQR